MATVWRMPGMTGLDVLQHLRSNRQAAHLPVIILTAFAESHNTIEAMKLRVRSFDETDRPR